VDASGQATVGSVRLCLAGDGGGIEGWSLRDVAEADIDGLPTRRCGQFAADSEASPPDEGVGHANGAIRVDHIVVSTPQLARTVGAFEDAGIELRRLREPGEPGPRLRQAFFRLGEVILELVEDEPGGEGPARFWGITFCVGDIAACAQLLGERLGEVRPAVQSGRRIGTVRRQAGLGLPVALISP
jgi:hypothetical protein